MLNTAEQMGFTETQFTESVQIGSLEENAASLSV